MSKNTPVNWFSPAHALWKANKQLAAVQCMVDEINRQLTAGKNPKNTALGHFFAQAGFYAYETKNYALSTKMARSASEALPNHMETQQNLMVCLQKTKQYQDCVQLAESLLAKDKQDKDNQCMLYDVLATAYWQLCQPQKAIAAGSQSLDIKHQKQKKLATTRLALPQPISRFIKGKKSVIAFSLFGKQPRYLYGAIRNLSLMADIYPNWEAWIYLDDSVPEEYTALYANMGAILKKQPNHASLREKLSWRFQVANASEVGRFLVRDIDSVINIREKVAVDAWIKSEKTFHVMRDWWTHTDLMLAGMWGGIAGVLPDMQTLLANHKSTVLETTHVDQEFLEHGVWQYVQQSVCIHDRYFSLQDKTLAIVSENPWANMDKLAKITHNTPIFFTENGNASIDKHHIGCCEYTVRQDFQKKMVRPWLTLMPTLQTSTPKNDKHQLHVQAKQPVISDTGKVHGKLDVSKLNNEADFLQAALAQIQNKPAK